MRMNKKTPLFLVVSAISVGLSGCQVSDGRAMLRTGPSAAGPDAAPSFLSDYSRLVESRNPKWPHARTYISPGRPLDTYTAVIIDPVEVRVTPSADPTVEERLRGFSRYFDMEIRNRLQGVFTISEVPGPGVLRVRTALTNPEGRLGAEMQILDSQSGDELAAATDRIAMSDARPAFRDWAMLIANGLDVEKATP